MVAYFVKLIDFILFFLWENEKCVMANFSKSNVLKHHNLATFLKAVTRTEYGWRVNTLPIRGALFNFFLYGWLVFMYFLSSFFWMDEVSWDGIALSCLYCQKILAFHVWFVIIFVLLEEIVCFLRYIVFVGIIFLIKSRPLDWASRDEQEFLKISGIDGNRFK